MDNKETPIKRTVLDYNDISQMVPWFKGKEKLVNRLLKFLSVLSYPSTFVPLKVIASQYSWSVHASSGTYALIHDNAVFIYLSSLELL